MTETVTAHTPVTYRSTSVTDVPFEPGVGGHLEHSAESQARRWGFAAFDMAAAWTTSWLGYTSTVLERRSTPLDILGDVQRFWSVTAERPSPAWATPFEVVKEWPAVRLLDFSTEPDSDVVATLFLPPQAGHASTIVDYTAEQSQVRTALEQGLTRLFVLDWRSATEQSAATTIEDYIAVLDEVVAKLGGSVNLVGDCQGGWLATIYAALRPHSVASLSIGAAPIDFHAGHGAIHDWISTQRASADPMWLYRTLVEANGGVHPGEVQVNGFKMMEPAGEMNRLADLWAHIGEPEYVDRYRDFIAWFETPQDMPGAFYLWTVEHLFMNNELIAGTLEVGGETVDLSRITMPIHLLAGSDDHITPPEQVWALAEHVSTPKKDIDSHFVEAGHLGLFMGRRALKDHWAPLFRDVKAENGRRARGASEPAAKAAPATKSAHAKKSVPVVKSAPATKPAPAKKSVPVVKAAPATKSAPAKKSVPVVKSAPAAATALAKQATPAAKPVPTVKSAPVKKSAPGAQPAAATKVAPAATSTPATKPATGGTSAPVAKPAPAKSAPAVTSAPVKASAPVVQPAPAAASAPVREETASRQG